MAKRRYEGSHPGPDEPVRPSTQQNPMGIFHPLGKAIPLEIVSPEPCPACGSTLIGFDSHPAEGTRRNCKCGVAGPWSRDWDYNEMTELWNALPRQFTLSKSEVESCPSDS